ncbi:low molecular weight phosphatase family protein [uncultured Jatrophihabitans sp.]|uniref:arsenate reductase/protein-tyrosine-phosphatase family protein n=1 Tax=uncultured Jatrophihabitans sp. TaxID=1610747 RepID=UPI0035CC019B
MHATGARTPFTVLLVCTANRYRSPVAEHLLRAELAARADWVIGSAGTQAREGEELDSRVAALVGVPSGDAGSWRSRRLTAQLVEQADLVLTAEEAHRQVVVQMWPRALHHTFALLSFARLAAQLPNESVASGHALIEAVNQARTHTQPPQAGADDIVDPVRHLRRKLPACAGQIRGAVTALSAPLVPMRVAANHAR